jgi:hypothetical protein
LLLLDSLVVLADVLKCGTTHFLAKDFTSESVEAWSIRTSAGCQPSLLFCCNYVVLRRKTIIQYYITFSKTSARNPFLNGSALYYAVLMRGCIIFPERYNTMASTDEYLLQSFRLFYILTLE